MPKSFRFKLQPVLEQRLREERQRQVEVARLEAERAKLESKIRDQQGFLTQSKQAMRDAMGGESEPRTIADGGHRVNPHVLRSQATNAIHIKFRAQQAVLGLAGLHTRLAEARGRLTEAAKKRRGLELLREERERAWKAEIERKERTDLDELVTARAAASGDFYSARPNSGEPRT